VGATDADKKKSENIIKSLYNLSTDAGDDNTRYYKGIIDIKITLLKELIL